MDKQLSVYHFYEIFQKRFKLKNLTDKELTKGIYIRDSRINKIGLELTGFIRYFNNSMVHILADNEKDYIREMYEQNSSSNIIKLLKKQPACIVSLGQKPLCKLFIADCKKYHVNVMSTKKDSSRFIHDALVFLDYHFAPITTVHGTLVDVHGTGILLMGRSGIGKSEIALELIERGHRLVTDDAVTVAKRGNNVLIGSGAFNDINPYMEIRGMGIVNVKEVFGIKATRVQKRIEIVVHLEDWDKNKDYERLGDKQQFIKIHGVKIPKIILPIYPGKNITVISEVIALSHQLRVYGYNAAKELDSYLVQQMMNPRHKKHYINLEDYLQDDYE